MKKSTAQWSGHLLGFVVVFSAFFIASVPLLAQEAPTLPPGIEEPRPKKPETQNGGPALPEGLGSELTPDMPTLPSGLNDGLSPTKESNQPSTVVPLGFSGFWEALGGGRIQNDPNEKEVSIAETRLQVQLEQSIQQTTFHLTADFLYDPVLDRHDIDLEKGEGMIDLREARVLLRPGEVIDLNIGRQILTWGTGDLIFINDLFPKDWNAFFIGRDTEYLKAPSDAVKASLFSALANLDIVYTPRFDPDRFIDGQRISYFNAQSGRRAGRNAVVQADTPDEWFDDDEIAWRLYQNIRGIEVAFYGYRGYWKSPGGFDLNTGQAIFPALSVYGGSARSAVWDGIGNLEVGYYNSEDDSDGDDPLVRNSEFRFLAGYEQEIVQNLTAGFQYYLEHMLDHAAYVRTLPVVSPKADENRHVVTLRLTQLLMNQDLMLSLFTFYSPSDEDVYLRPKAEYKLDDFWSVAVGGNIFFGKEQHTFFGQFKENSNVYAGVRYGF